MSYFNSNNGSGSNRSFGGGGSRGRSDYRSQDRQMHSAVCDKCGRDCQVPFRPDGSKPIYCSSCFENVQDTRDSRDSRSQPRFNDTKRFEPARKDNNQSNDLLVSINSKLDKIVNLLSEYKPCVCETDSKPVKKAVEKKTEKKVVKEAKKDSKEEAKANSK